MGFQSDYKYVDKLTSINVFPMKVSKSETYWEPCQTTKIENFVTLVNGVYPFTTFAKCSILDIWQGSEYASLSDSLLAQVC